MECKNFLSLIIVLIVLSVNNYSQKRITLPESTEKSGIIESVNWSALGTGINATVYAVLAVGTAVYAGGSFQSAGGVTVSNIAKWNGTNWSALGSGVNGTVQGLAYSGGNIYAVGSFNQAGGINARGVAKWNGTSWSAMGGGLYNDPKCIVVSGNDIYVGGAFTSASNDGVNFFTVNNVAKWNGSSWSALGSGTVGVNSTVYSLAMVNGILYAGGAFTSAGGNSASAVARFNGTTWSALGTGVNNYVYAITNYGSDIFVGGAFNYAGGNSALRIAKWNGSTWSALGSGLNGDCEEMIVVGEDLIVGGGFTTAGGVTVNRIARWDGSSWTSLGAGTNSTVRAFARSGGDLYVGGSFSQAGGNNVYYIAYAYGVYIAGAGLSLPVSGGGGTVSFNDDDNITAVSLNLNSGAGSGLVDIYRLESPPELLTKNITGNISNYRWIIESQGLATSFTGNVRFKVADIPNSGITDPSKITVYSRPIPGAGSFSSLTTSYDAVNGEIVASVTSFSEFVFASNDNPLPVELLSFKAEQLGDEVILKWITASEVNNFCFEVERNKLIDGVFDEWQRLGSVMGYGNSNSPKEYNFKDNLRNNPGTNIKYRLKQIDNDGQFSYSNIIELADIKPIAFILMQNYPNPFNPSTIISYQLPERSNVSLKLFDILGNEIATLVNEEKDAGAHDLELDISDYKLTSGVYLFRIQAGNFIAARKMVVMK